MTTAADKLHVERLRLRAKHCRYAACIPTNGGHETDMLLLQMADRLEREADAILAQAPPA